MENGEEKMKGTAGTAMNEAELLQHEVEPDFTSFDTADVVPPKNNLRKEGAERKKKGDSKNTEQDWKSTLLFSGAVLAVVGLIFAVAKKIKEAK